MANVTLATSDNFKTGTISAISGTTLTSTDASTDFSANDVGRILVIRNGTGGNTNARYYYRRIVSRTDNNNIELEAAWGETPFRTATDANNGGAYTEEIPEAGNQYVVCKTLDEIAATYPDDISFDTATRSFKMTTDGDSFTIPANVFVYGENITLEFNYGADDFIVDIHGGIILGRQNFGDVDDDTVDGYPSHGCTFIDTSTANKSGNPNTGMFNMNGGKYICTGTQTFLRYYGDGNSNTQAIQNFRFWNTVIEGPVGGRTGGERSVLYGVENIGNTSANWFNTLDPGVNENNASRGSAQAVYSFPDLAGSTTVGAITLQDITSQLITVNTGGSPSGSTTTLQDWDFDVVDSITTGTSVDIVNRIGNSASNAQNIHFRKNLDLTLSPRSDLTETNKISLVSAQDVTTTITDNGGGIFERQDLLAYAGNAASSSIGQLSNMTKHTDYDFVCIAWGFLLNTGSEDLISSPGVKEVELSLTADENLSVTTRSTVAAYTELDNDGEVYDRQFIYKFDNPAEPTLQTQFFTKSGSLLTATGDYHVTFDSSATDVFDYDSSTSTITVKSATAGYVGGISSENSTVTFDNTIQGEVNATTIAFSGTAPSTIIDTDQAVAGSLTLDAGTYIVNDADISGMTFSKGTGDGDVIIRTNADVSGSGDATFNTGTQLETSLTVTISGAANSTDGKMHFWDSDSYTATISEQTGTDNTIRSGDVAELTVGNEIVVVWSEPGYDDVRETITLVAGSNEITASTSSQGLPLDTTTATSTATYTLATNILLVDVSGADDGRLTRGETNVFVNDVKLLDEYLQAVAHSETTDLIMSQGAANFASVSQNNVTFTPGENASQQLEFVEARDGTLSITSNLTVSATIDGNTEDVTFTMDIPSTPPTFDGNFIQSVVSETEDTLDSAITSARKRVIGTIWAK